MLTATVPSAQEMPSVDVRSIADVEPEVEHNGTVPVWWMIRPREMQAITEGGYLELANEFEVAPGAAVFPHTHPTHEFYFVMRGAGTMVVSDERREIGPGDLVYIPPDAVHSLETIGDDPIHCFCFAVGTKDAGVIDYTNH